MHIPAGSYAETAQPGQGLPQVFRHITGHNSEGKSVFLSTNSGDYHKTAIANSSHQYAVEPIALTNGALSQNEPNGSVCRMVDFAPGATSPLNRANTLDYAVVIEGVFNLVLDSGEERILKRGDMAVQQSAAHRWVNVTGNGALPGRMLFVLLDDTKVPVKAKARVGRGRAISNAYSDEFFESEF